MFFVKIVFLCSFILFNLSTVLATSYVYRNDRNGNVQLSKEAKNVLHYLQSVYGKVILSGQEENNVGGLTKEQDYLYQITGKYPALRGYDIRTDVPNPVYDAVKSWKERNQLITFSWHLGAPPLADSYNNSKKEASISAVLKKGTPENQSFMLKLDSMANRLEILKKNKVPVLWRPFHEMNGEWFWWGPNKANGNDGAAYVELWKFMFNYFTKYKKLDNLIWVWSGSFEIDASFFPGTDYVDLIGTDTYHKVDYKRWTKEFRLLEALPGKLPIALTENDTIPDPDFLVGEYDVKWLWFLTWHTQWLRLNSPEFLKKVYHHNLIITADELPNLKKAKTSKKSVAKF